MKAIVKIVLSIMVITACVNAGRAAFADYQFQDAVHESLLFAPRATDEEITEMVMKIAAEQDVPIAAEDITVRRGPQQVTIQMTYTSNVVLIPGVFAQDWTFTPSAETRVFPSGR